MDFQISDTPAFSGDVAACSGLTPGSAVSARLCKEGATPGVDELEATHDGPGVRRLFHFELVVAAGAGWEAGDWTVTFDITTPAAQLIWQELSICRIDAAGVSQETIGTATGIGLSMTTPTRQVTVPGAEQTPANGDRVYIVAGFTNNLGTPRTVGVSAAQVITSPFVAHNRLEGFKVLIDSTEGRAV